MKILAITSTIIIAISLTACGGGKTDTNVVATPNTSAQTPAAINPSTTSPAQTSEGKLIIDNGRGTTNGHDTERVK